MKSARVSMPDDDYEVMEATATAKGFGNVPTLLRFGAYQYLTRIGIKLPSAVRQEQQAKEKDDTSGQETD